MMQRILALALVVSLPVVLPSSADQKVAQGPGSAVMQVAWLSGCWLGEAGEECWLPPLGGEMIGINRSPIAGKEPPAFEFLRIIEQGGGLVYLASPGGRYPATPFKAVEVSTSRVVFANPEHDFPQRITYWREGETLHARVDAQEDGEWKGFDLSWARATWRRE
jgi:hypothetical protein